MGYKRTVWVTGSKGYLGREMVARLKGFDYTVYDTDIEVDITDLEAVTGFADRIRPDVVVNCAGLPREGTSPDNRLEAYRSNALGARNLAAASNQAGAIIVQISSDDVFASRPEPYNEFDTPNPAGIYGKSKYAGEQLVRELNPRHIIVRSSFLYHADGGRLAQTLAAARAGQRISARTDQFAAPTSIASYANFVARAIDMEEFGTYHAVTRGRASRYEFAALALKLAGYDPAAILTPETDLDTAANVVLEPLMADLTGVADMPTWEDDLGTYLKETGIAKEGA